jgi:hypothetical protein
VLPCRAAVRLQIFPSVRIHLGGDLAILLTRIMPRLSAPLAPEPHVARSCVAPADIHCLGRTSSAASNLSCQRSASPARRSRHGAIQSSRIKGGRNGRRKLSPFDPFSLPVLSHLPPSTMCIDGNSAPLSVRYLNAQVCPFIIPGHARR